MEQTETKIFKGRKDTNSPYRLMVTLPKEWVVHMGITKEERDVTLSFDGDRITIERPPMSGVKYVPLASTQKIRRFALIWAQMYKNHKSIPYDFFENIAYVGEGLSDLGFVMDCEESASNMFPDEAFNECEGLVKILDKIDLQTLGNLIYSEWRYWNHWAMSPMTDKDYDWFVIAFERLAELADSHSSNEA